MRHFPVVLAWFGSELLIQLLIAAAVIWIIWKLLVPRPLFNIRIRQGTVSVVHGTVRSQFLSDLTDIITKEGLTHGTITARQDAKRIVLKFSREIHPAVQQQIRNTWHASL